MLVWEEYVRCEKWILDGVWWLATIMATGPSACIQHTLGNKYAGLVVLSPEKTQVNAGGELLPTGPFEGIEEMRVTLSRKNFSVTSANLFSRKNLPEKNISSRKKWLRAREPKQPVYRKFKTPPLQEFRSGLKPSEIRWSPWYYVSRPLSHEITRTYWSYGFRVHQVSTTTTSTRPAHPPASIAAGAALSALQRLAKKKANHPFLSVKRLDSKVLDYTVLIVPAWFSKAHAALVNMYTTTQPLQQHVLDLGSSLKFANCHHLYLVVKCMFKLWTDVYAIEKRHGRTS